MKKTEIIDALRESVIKGDSEAAKRAAEEALSSNIPPMEAINEGLMKGILEVGERFGRLELFLSELMLSASAMQSGIAILRAKMTPEKRAESTFGKIVIGTVAMDIHDIGKNLVSTMLTAAGFEVYDMGIDVSSKKFIEKAEEVNADIIALSALLTTTRPFQRDVLDLLKSMGKREKYKVLLGGGAVSQEWADLIGADGYARDASEAPSVAKKIIGRA